MIDFEGSILKTTEGSLPGEYTRRLSHYLFGSNQVDVIDYIQRIIGGTFTVAESVLYINNQQSFFISHYQSISDCSGLITQQPAVTIYSEWLYKGMYLVKIAVGYPYHLLLSS